MSKFAAISISKKGNQNKTHISKKLEQSEKNVSSDVAKLMQQLKEIQHREENPNTTYISKKLEQSEKTVSSDVAKLMQQLKEIQHGEKNQTISEEALAEHSIGTSSSVQANYKTPNQPIVATDPRRNKKTKKISQLQREDSINELEGSFIEDEFDQVPDKDIFNNSTPKRSRSESRQDKVSGVPKYIKLSPEKGRILTGYYTAGHEEKLNKFTPTYVNIGNPKIPKELVGVRKNTKFVSINGKSKVKSDTYPNYLVLSFENRNKPNSPFIEYPLTRLDVLIKALMEIKEYATQNGYYEEKPILSCKYREDTKISAKDDKETTLEIIV